jgi:hypothetical protein
VRANHVNRNLGKFACNCGRKDLPVMERGWRVLSSKCLNNQVWHIVTCDNCERTWRTRADYGRVIALAQKRGTA